MKSVTVQELKHIIDSGLTHQLIDVREPFEADEFSIGGELIPLGTLMACADRVSKDMQVIVYCSNGNRAGKATHLLEDLGHTNVYCLTGGLLAWNENI